MKNKNILIIILMMAAGGGAFFGGVKYQQSKIPAGRFGNFQAERNGGQSQSRAGQGARPVNGEIIAVDDKSITVKLQDGSSKIIILSDTTAVNKSAEGSRDDLKMGEKVGVFGTENSDGSIMAQNIQLNPTMRFPSSRSQ